MARTSSSWAGLTVSLATANGSLAPVFVIHSAAFPSNVGFHDVPQKLRENRTRCCEGGLANVTTVGLSRHR